MSAQPDKLSLIVESQRKLLRLNLKFHRDLERLTALVEAKQSSRAGLIGTATTAKMLGRGHDWVRAHAKELGVVRTTNGPKPRLMFVRSRIEEIATGGANASPPSPPKAAAPRKRQPTEDRPELLPVKARRG